MAANIQTHTSLHATCNVTSEFTMNVAASIEPNSFNLPLSSTYLFFNLPPSPDKSCRGDADLLTPAHHREAEGRFRRPCPLRKMSDAALGLPILPKKTVKTATSAPSRRSLRSNQADNQAAARQTNAFPILPQEGGGHDSHQRVVPLQSTGRRSFLLASPSENATSLEVG